MRTLMNYFRPLAAFLMAAGFGAVALAQDIQFTNDAFVSFNARVRLWQNALAGLAGP